MPFFSSERESCFVKEEQRKEKESHHCRYLGGCVYGRALVKKDVCYIPAQENQDDYSKI